MKQITKSTISTSILIFALHIIAVAQQSNKFFINGRLENMESMPDKVFLLYPDYLSRKPDSATVVKGTYKFAGEIESDAIEFTLALGPELDQMHITESVKARLIVVEGETQVISEGTISNVRETGASADVSHQFNEVFAKALQGAKVIVEKIQSVGYLTRNEVRIQALKEYESSYFYLNDAQSQFVKKYPASKLTPLMAYYVAGGSSVSKYRADSLISILEMRNDTSKIATLALTKLKEKSVQFSSGSLVSEGKPAPDFTQNDVNGTPTKLSDFRGKYVLVDFWASWCGPCRAENPALVNAYNAFKDKNFTILGVSMDFPGKKDAWLAAIKNDGLIWTQVSDLKGWENEASKIYSVQSIPANFLIDPSGKIIGKNLRGSVLYDTLVKLLAQK